LVRINFLKIFLKFNIKRVYPINEIFNHELHEAISTVLNNNIKNNTVVKVVQAGYILNNVLIKPATVIVSVHSKK